MTEQVVAVQQNLRGAMYYMEREIRIAGYDPKRTNDFGITAISAQSITVTMDTGKADGTGKDDGVMTPANGETITYDYNGGDNTITRNAGAGAQVIAENVTGLTFTGLTAHARPCRSMTIRTRTNRLIKLIKIETKIM